MLQELCGIVAEYSARVLEVMGWTQRLVENEQDLKLPVVLQQEIMSVQCIPS